MADDAARFGRDVGDEGGRAGAELEEWQVAEIRKALAEAARREFAAEGAVDALFRKWGARSG